MAALTCMQVDFPNDPLAWSVTDQFMFGPDYVMAPVTEMGARNWTAYLPGDDAVMWTNVFSNVSFAGGQTVNIDVPLDEFPLFRRTDGLRS